MAYNEDGNWIYEQEIPTSGDPIRVAGIGLARAVESYLFDYRHPGYNKPEFLEWARAAWAVNASSSGTHANVNALQWDPTKAEIAKRPDGQASFTPAGQVDFGLKSTPPNFGDKAEFGEAQVYGVNEVADPNMARFRNGNAVVVNQRDARDYAPPTPAPEPAVRSSKAKDEVA